MNICSLSSLSSLGKAIAELVRQRLLGLPGDLYAY